ncbi:transglutaminase-like domain-containing protein [Aliiglaciecola sp. LCG003]|uniref:transglutaminase-like domain-containing protein n=1 Tax=Aliiglaciecola sp. LCG003 TaxID=3053655 RepID=UPI0025735B1C|nr:transglutaminase-like domain-containing protein [Aliiglaciecola sp. LCG003]WJG09642.1 transglutaminase-like domain-containing protein [Aliiglaciecola sp. LCG003]
MDQARYIQTTPILDFHHPLFTKLVSSRNWRGLNQFEQIGAAYQYVKDEIQFGYNENDDIPASQVMLDGYGQCNTKGALLMALLRSLGIPCRFHGFTIHQNLQKGAIPAWILPFAPTKILHSWVEVWFKDRWVNLEGFILDINYLTAIQQKFARQSGRFCGFGIATLNLSSPPVNWNGQDTFIQKEGIADDFGVFDAPDVFYAQQGTNVGGLRKIVYQRILRHIINWNVARLRRCYKGNR